MIFPTQSHTLGNWMDVVSFRSMDVVAFRRRFQNRVAMRFLCGHYLALSSPQRDGLVGLVQRGVSLTEIAQVRSVVFLSFVRKLLLLNVVFRVRMTRPRRSAFIIFHIHIIVGRIFWARVERFERE